MSDKTNIEWCDSTFNPWIGCTKISPACDNCYAEALMDKRMGKAEWGPDKERVRTSVANWKNAVKWNAKPFYQCDACGHRFDDPIIEYMLLGAEHKRCSNPRCGSWDLYPARRRVFCASLADVFDNGVPWEWRLDLFALISNTPNLDWLLLTKRIGNVKPMLDEIQVHGPLGDVFPNIWLGSTICNQEEADRDIPKLLKIPAAKRFLSIEPLLGKIDLENLPSASGIGRYLNSLTNAGVDPMALIANKIDWVIVGGESGTNARPMLLEWVLSLRDQCTAAQVPFLFKQWGEWSQELQRVGKKAAGRLLDGFEYTQFPEDCV